MAPTLHQLRWQSLTEVINEIKSPNQFFKKLLFGKFETKATDTIELSYLKRGRKTAPFVEKNGEAISIEGHDEEFVVVEAPNIRIKRPFTPGPLLEARRVGTRAFVNRAEMNAAINAHIGRDMEVLGDNISDTEEWMCASALKGKIQYQVSPNANFQITYPKPAAHTYTAAALWDAGTPGNPDIDFKKAKRLMSKEVGLAPNNCIMGELASDAFLANADVQKKLDTRNYNAGLVTIESQFTEDGAIWLGRFAGINCWEYGRTVDFEGTDTKLMADKDVHFVHAGSAAKNITYYASIPDMRALAGGTFQRKRFSKSWQEEDPSALISLVHTRPLPWMRRPGSVVTVTVAT